MLIGVLEQTDLIAKLTLWLKIGNCKTSCPRGEIIKYRKDTRVGFKWPIRQCYTICRVEAPSSDLACNDSALQFPPSTRITLTSCVCFGRARYSLSCRGQHSRVTVFSPSAVLRRLSILVRGSGPIFTVRSFQAHTPFYAAIVQRPPICRHAIHYTTSRFLKAKY